MSDISGNGGQVIHLKDTGSGIAYAIDNGSFSAPITSWPVTIINNTPESGTYLTVVFDTDLNFISSADKYFICGSEYIQFGDTSLRPNGTRATITIISVTDFLGLIKNGVGDTVAKGYSNIRVFNIQVGSAGSTNLINGGGWICQSYFGYGATNNIIINCRSTSDISDISGGENSGGIVGQYAGNTFNNGEILASASLRIIGCSSRGNISTSSGGIAGSNFANDQTSIVTDCSILECYSTGKIGVSSISLGESAGGIIGSYAGSNNNEGSLLISKCYSTGDIDTNGKAGGVSGNNVRNIIVESSYSRGIINKSNSGGIIGLCDGNPTVVVSNCYSTGTIVSEAGGIFGSTVGTANNCYTSGASPSGNGIWAGSSYDTLPDAGVNNYGEANHDNFGFWDSTHANNGILIGVPASSAVGSIWAIDPTDSLGPYIFSSFGYTPYSANNIDPSTLELVKIYSQTIQPGESTHPALIISNHTFYILSINGEYPSNYPGISIDLLSGAITTLPSITMGTYDIVVLDKYNEPSQPRDKTYTTTRVLLTVYKPPCCTPTSVYAHTDYNTITAFRTGNALVLERYQKPGMRFASQTDYAKYKMALGRR